MAPDIDTAGDGIKLVVIGAGLAGLAAALATKIANPNHHVTICETVKELQEVGAGLQVTPNATRLFRVWGVYEELAKAATAPTSLTVRRYDGTKVLAHEPRFQEQVEERYGAPFWGLHRVDLQRALTARCSQLGVDIRLGARVVAVDFARAVARLDDGTEVAGDVILCADGLWSATRPQFLGRPSPAVLTGDLAFRIVLDAGQLGEGPHRAELEAFVRGCTVNFWAGPGRHVVSYTMRAGTVLNMVLLCPDDLPDGVAREEGSLEEMRALFADWDPLLRRLLGEVKAVHKWRLMWLDPLPEWANREGTFFMAGDCCHPMIPYLAQGANSSLEDGATLGFLLGRVARTTRAAQLPRAAEMYQRLRMQRGREIQEESMRQRDDFHLPDGPEQEARDARMLSMLGRELEAPFPSRWTCPSRQRFLYGYDAYAEVEKAYARDPF